MAGQDHCLVRQGAKLPLDGIVHDRLRSAGKVGPPYGLHEEGVSGKGVAVHVEDDAPRGVTGGMDDLEPDCADLDRSPSLTVLSAGGDGFAPNIRSIVAGVATSISASSSWMMIPAPVAFLISKLPPM